jgi:membrane protein required for colicin V production
MQTADIIILVVIALPALVGVIYGFLNIAFSMLAWALALGISAKFSSYFSVMLEASVETPFLRSVLAFVGLFIISLIILTAIGFLIVKLLGRTGLTATDRILGLFFGMGLGAVIVVVVVFLAGFTALPSEVWWDRSLILQPFERISIWAQQFLPESMAKYHGYEVIIPEPQIEQYQPDTQPEPTAEIRPGANI